MELGNLNLRNILGQRNGSNIACRITKTNRFGSQSVTQATFNVDAAGNLIASSGDNQYVEFARNNGGTEAGELCGHSFTDGSLVSFTGAVESVTGENTGVYEYSDFAYPFAALAITLIIIMRGIHLAKRFIRGVTEETSEEDAIEWYEDGNGRERWRLKPYIRNRM